jgi:tetratricopeptide (TPR) repeat protein
MAKRYEKVNDVEGAIGCWNAFSELKESKGSYFLAAYGYYQCSRLATTSRQTEQSIAHLQKALRLTAAHSFSLDLFLSYDLACKYEVTGHLRQALEQYESIGKKYESDSQYFIAADAYEHAAEIRYALGLPARTYDLPLDAWEKNSLYWQQMGEEDDAKWSRERKQFYKSLYRD